MAVASLTASAQWYVGGGLNLHFTSLNGGGTNAALGIAPEVGYVINRNWGVGVGLDYSINSNVKNHFSIEPYARYFFASSSSFHFVCDGGFRLFFQNPYDKKWNFYLAPGIAVRVAPKFTFLVRTNLLTYTKYSYGDKFDFFGNARGIEIGTCFTP